MKKQTIPVSQLSIVKHFLWIITEMSIHISTYNFFFKLRSFYLENMPVSSDLDPVLLIL